MAKPTPWGRSPGSSADSVHSSFAGTSDSAAASDRAVWWNEQRAAASALLWRARGRAENIRTAPRLSGKWGYIFSAFGGVVTFFLMFKHWLVARGPDGTAAATAFGQVDSTTRYLAVWSSQGPPPAADLTGSWAVTACTTIAITLAAVAIYIVTDSPRFARIATVASVSTAVLIVVDLLYLTARQKDLKAMTSRRWDLGGQIGSWVNWAFNDGTKPVAGLNQVEYVASGTITSAAIAAVITTVGGAAVALAMMPRSATGSAWIPWRISVSRSTTANYTVSDTERRSEPFLTADTPTTEPEAPEQARNGPPSDDDGPMSGPASPQR